MATGEFAAHAVHVHATPTSWIRKYVFSLDHKVIGIQYFFLALTAVFVGMFLSLLMRIHLIWPAAALPLLGRPARTNSSVRATAAVTTVKESTSKGPRRVRWTGHEWSWRRMGRSWWTCRNSLNGPRGSLATSAIPVRI